MGLGRKKSSLARSVDRLMESSFSSRDLQNFSNSLDRWILENKIQDLEKQVFSDQTTHSIEIQSFLKDANTFGSLHQTLFPAIKQFIQNEKGNIEANFKGTFISKLNDNNVTGRVTETEISQTRYRNINLKLSESDQDIQILYDIDQDRIIEYKYSEMKKSAYVPDFLFCSDHSKNDAQGTITSRLKKSDREMKIQIQGKRIRKILVKNYTAFVDFRTIFQASFNSEGKLHSSDGPAIYLEDDTQDLYQSLFYYSGKKIGDNDLSTLDKTIQTTRNKVQQRREQTILSSKKKRFGKKEKINVEEAEDNYLLDRIILFEDIERLRFKMGTKLDSLHQLLKTIENIFEQETNEFYGTIIYDHQNKEIVINRELISEMGLHSVESLQEKYQEEYFSSITENINRLEKAYSGILSLLAEQTERPLGIKIGNPKTNIKNKTLQPLTQKCFYTAKTQENIAINFKHMQDEEGLVYIMNSEGELDNKSMVNYLTVEQTFTNEDLKEIIVKLENDLREIEIHIETVQENIEIVKQHIQEHQTELKKEVIQLFNSEEQNQEDYFSANLKNEY